MTPFLFPVVLPGLFVLVSHVSPVHPSWGAQEQQQEALDQTVLVPWLGCWRDAGRGEEFLWFEPERCGRLRGDSPVFHRVVYSADGAWLESWARDTELGLMLDGDALVVTEAGEERRFERAPEVPSGLLAEPYELPSDVELDEDIVSVLQSDLKRRVAEDQRVRTQPAAHSEMQRVDEDNTEFLLNVIREVGWIDVTRFGREAGDAAFLLVQHSFDLRLLRTALPYIEEDVQAKRLGGQAFALLFDRLQLRLGYRQRFGSQIGVIANETYVLMPCEDFERVDELRAELGMGSLADYLALFEEDGRSVKRLEEVLAPPAR